MIGLRRLGSVVVVLAGAVLAGRSALAAEATMVVSADQPGPQFPETGRSLFDELFATPSGYDIPFPFERMIEALNARLAPAAVRTALIPLGRSLQRYAADPDYFQSPRLVVAIDAEAAEPRLDTPRLKDRLFLGYQPAAETIEVISYNEAAGRFEFQEVSDYGAGQIPRVGYVARGICVTCHQGHAPIFPRPLWSESNGNPEIAERLTGLGKQYHGAPVRQGVDSLDDIDQSTDRANRIGAVNLLWNEGCGDGAAGIDCRAAVLNAALRYRLAGSRVDWTATGMDGQAVRLQERLSHLWPGGLATTNPDLPNRDPIEALKSAKTPSAILDTAGAINPETRRAPLRHWSLGADAQATFTALARDVGGLFSAADILWLDGRLAARTAPVVTLDASCLLQRVERDGARRELRMACGGPGETLSLAGFVIVAGRKIEDGRIDTLSIGKDSGITRLRVTGGAVTRDGSNDSVRIMLRDGSAGMNPRLLTGTRIVTLQLHTEDATHGRVEVELADDLAALDAAIGDIGLGDDAALGDGPPRRQEILASLEHAFAEQ